MLYLYIKFYSYKTHDVLIEAILIKKRELTFEKRVDFCELCGHVQFGQKLEGSK